MPRPPPQPLALALVVANFISQLRIAQRRQAIRCNKLPLPRCEPLRISSPSIVPLVRHAARLVNPSGKHSFHVSLWSYQRLSQINYFPLLSSRSDPRPVSAHILSRDPSRLPVPRPQQLPLRLVLHKFHRISTLIFFLTLSRFLTLPRRIRKLFPLRLSRVLRRILRRLSPLRPPSSHHHQHTQHHKQPAAFTLCPPC